MRALTLVMLAIFSHLGIFAEEASRDCGGEIIAILSTEISLKSKLLERYEAKRKEIETAGFHINKQANLGFLDVEIARLKREIVGTKNTMISYESALEKQFGKTTEAKPDENWALYSLHANRALLFKYFIEYSVTAEKFRQTLPHLEQVNFRADEHSRTLDRVGKNMKAAIDGNSRARDELIESVEVDNTEP